MPIQNDCQRLPNAVMHELLLCQMDALFYRQQACSAIQALQLGYSGDLAEKSWKCYGLLICGYIH